MIKRILTFIKAPWICEIVTKATVGLASVLTVIAYVREQVEGSEVGEKINKVLDEVEGFINSILEIFGQVSGLLCGGATVATAKDVISVEDALNNLSKVSKELDDLKK